jgi:hypothetical protein
VEHVQNLLPVLLLGGVALALLVVTLVLPGTSYRVKAVPHRRVDHAFHHVGTLHFRGGVRLGAFNATVGTARLQVDRSYAQITVLFHRTTWIARDEVTGVRKVVALGISPGIVFTTADGHLDGVIFWTFSPRRVLGGFRSLGWPVDGHETGREPGA